MMPGKPVADAVFADLEPRVAALRAGGRNPGLGTILVGNESASAGYIRMKQDRAASLGFGGRHVHLDDDASQADLVAAIRDFNTDDEVDAVLIQHPIPPHLDYEAALTELDPDKDADGAHPMNMGRLALGMAGRCPALRRASRRCCCTMRFPSPGVTWWCWAAASRSVVRCRCCCR